MTTEETVTEVTEVIKQVEEHVEEELPAEVEGQPPKFLKQPEDVEAQPGQRAVLTVLVSGSPLPEVTWYRDGKVS